MHELEWEFQWLFGKECYFFPFFFLRGKWFVPCLILMRLNLSKKKKINTTCFVQSDERTTKWLLAILFQFLPFLSINGKEFSKRARSGQEFDRLLKKEFSIQILILKRDIERIFSPELYTLIFIFFLHGL